jgi:heme O synthase-like polyprenyltransferase
MNPSVNNTNYRHIIYPGFMLLLFFVVALSPVNLLGCRTRGLLALVIALACGLSAVFAAIKALKSRLKGDADSQWWMITTIILTIPVVAMIIMA